MNKEGNNYSIFINTLNKKRNTSFAIEDNSVTGYKAYYSRAVYLGYWKKSLSKS